MKKLLVLSLSVMLFSLTVLAQGKPKNWGVKNIH